MSGQEQAPLGRLAGTSRTSQYFCLRFHVLLSQALPRGSPHGHVCSGTRAGQAQARPAGATAPPVSGPGAVGALTADSLLHSGGSAGPIPNSEPIARYWEGRLPVAEGFQALRSCCSCSGRSLQGARWPQAVVLSDPFTPVAFGTAVPTARTSEEEMPERKEVVAIQPRSTAQ